MNPAGLSSSVAQKKETPMAQIKAQELTQIEVALWFTKGGIIARMLCLWMKLVVLCLNA